MGPKCNGSVLIKENDTDTHKGKKAMQTLVATGVMPSQTKACLWLDVDGPEAGKGKK